MKPIIQNKVIVLKFLNFQLVSTFLKYLYRQNNRTYHFSNDNSIALGLINITRKHVFSS